MKVATSLKIKPIKILPKMLLILAILVPIFKPAAFETFHALNVVVRGLKIIAIVAMMFYAANNMNIRRLSRRILFPVVSLSVFWAIYIFNSIRYHSLTESLVTNSIISILIVINVYCMSEKRDLIYLFRAVDIIFTIWIVIQDISLFVINENRAYFGMTGEGCNYFLGLDNYSAFAILPMLSILMYIDELIYMRIRMKEKILLLMSLLAHVYVRSATAMFAIGMLLFLLIFAKYGKQIFKYITVKRIAICLAVLWVLIFLFDIQNIFIQFLTSEFLGKGGYYYGTTLNSRTIIWQYAVELIKVKPLFGYGDLPEQRILDYALYGVDHCHNIFLEIIFRTGVVGAACYFLFLFKPFKATKKKLNKVSYRVLFISMISYLILSFMDYYPQLHYQYLLYAFVYFDDYIEEGIRKYLV